MARIEDGIGGKLSGKIGNIVGATWKGIPYIRTFPANWKDAKTDNQVKQRSKFTVTLSFIRTATKLIKIGFQSYADERKTAYNAAMSYNMKNAVKATDEGYVLDFEKVMISRGTLGAPAEVKIGVEGSDVVFEWSREVSLSSRRDDMAMLMIYNTQKCRGICDTNAGKREIGKASLNFLWDWAGDEIVAYLAFRNSDATEVSNSVFAGRLVLK